MTAEYNLPDDFDLDAPFDDPQAVNPSTVEQIAIEFEWSDWRDIVAENDSFDMVNMRPGIYPFAEDAILDAYDRGILDFCEIWWDGEDWHLIVTYTGD